MRVVRLMLGIVLIRHTVALQPTATEQSKSAFCITGQFRSAPLAYQSWKSGPLFKFLGSKPDLFVITSNTSSYYAWSDWIRDILKPKDLMLTSPHIEIKKEESDWTHRVVNGQFEVNMNRFPPLQDSGKYLSTLIQLLHLWHCSDLIQKSEIRNYSNKRYHRVVRVRTDVIVGVWMWPSRLMKSGVVPKTWTNLLQNFSVDDRGCTMIDNMIDIEAVKQTEDAIINECLSALPDGSSYVIHHEHFTLGPRDFMVNVVLVSLDQLADSKPLFQGVHIDNPISAIQQIYQVFIATDNSTGAALTNSNSIERYHSNLNSICLRAFGDWDIIRAIGPPSLSYHFQETEIICNGNRKPIVHAQLFATEDQCIITNNCVNFLNERWGVSESVCGFMYVGKEATFQSDHKLMVGDFMHNKERYNTAATNDGFHSSEPLQCL